MGDLDYLTQDVTIKDDVNGYKAYVTSNNELLVKDNTLGGEVLVAIASPHYFQENEVYYSMPVGGTLANKLETPIMYIDNPVSSGMDVEFYDMELGTPNNITFIFRLYFNPTITVNGTPITPVNLNTASTNTSSANVYFLPTASANGTLAHLDVITIGTLRSPLEFGLSVAEGTSALMTLQASSANNDYFLVPKWAEDTDV